MKLCDFTRDMLWRLRKEIWLCSLFYSDYENSFDLDTHEVCDFFDGYSEYLESLMIVDGHIDEGFFNLPDEYDNADNLWDWFCCIEF